MPHTGIKAADGQTSHDYNNLHGFSKCSYSPVPDRYNHGGPLRLT